MFLVSLSRMCSRISTLSLTTLAGKVERTGVNVDFLRRLPFFAGATLPDKETT